MISARIRETDREFLRSNNIGVTELITSAIFQRKNEIEGLSPNFEMERLKREKFQAKFTKAIKFMEENSLLDKWIEEDTKNAH